MKSFFRAIRLLLALKCHESTRLLSDECDHELSSVEKWAVRLHTLACVPCRRFRAQLRLIHRVIRRRADLRAKLSPEARQRIAERLQREM